MHHKNKNKYNKFTNTWRPNQCAPQYNTNTKTVKTYQHYNTLNTLLSKLHTHCQHTTITSLHFRVHYWKLHCMYYLQRAAMQQGSVESSESQNILPQAISHNTPQRAPHNYKHKNRSDVSISFENVKCMWTVHCGTCGTKLSSLYWDTKCNIVRGMQRNAVKVASAKQQIQGTVQCIKGEFKSNAS